MVWGERRQVPPFGEENSWLRFQPSDGEEPFPAAFRQVMRGVVMDAPAQEMFAPVVEQTIGVGGDKQRRIIFEYLDGTPWSWPELTAWQLRFQEMGQWPYLWGGPLGLTNSLTLAKTLDKATLRTVLSGCGHLPGPTMSVAEMRERAGELPLKNLEESLPPDTLKTARAKVRHAITWDICSILAHTITARYQNLVHVLRSTRPVTPQNYRPFSTTCPVEKAFCDKWAVGELIGLPPFFPGDRSSLILNLPSTRR
jgi:hypothetical protein